MTRATDNRTTELREKLDKLGIKHLDSDLPYNKQTRWNRGAGGWGACYVEITHGSILPADSIIDNCTLRIYDCTPEQAIAATLGSGTCRLDETASYSNANEVIHLLECSECGRTCEHVNGSYPRCPHCGRQVRE